MTSALTLDAGALIALERRDGFMNALISRAGARGFSVLIPASVLAQVWRDGSRNVRLARLLSATECEVVPLDLDAAKLSGVLLGRTGRRDVVDASVVVCAVQRGGSVVTSDPDDIRALGPNLEVFEI